MKSFRLRRLTIPLIWALGLALLTGATVQVVNSGRSLYAKLRLFSEVLDKIQTDYVEEKDPQALVENAIRGMVSNLDPHTTFMNVQQFEKWSQNFEGYSGIGIYFDVISDKITIMSVIPGGPSDKAGLASGDAELIDPENKTALWGAYGYTPDKDVLRVPMKLGTLPFSMDELTIAFIDMTADSGKLALMWDKTIASVPFKAGS